MFERMTEQPDNPKAVQYSLGLVEGKGACYARVILEVQQRKTDRVEVEAQAFEIDADGAILAAPNGAASRSPGTMHVIATSGIAGGTHTIKPGWVRVVGDYDLETIGEGVEHVTAKPTAEAELDTQVFDTTSGIQYRYDMGEIERIRQGKCEELLNILNQSAQIADLDF